MGFRENLQTARSETTAVHYYIHTCSVSGEPPDDRLRSESWIYFSRCPAQTYFVAIHDESGNDKTWVLPIAKHPAWYWRIFCSNCNTMRHSSTAESNAMRYEYNTPYIIHTEWLCGSFVMTTAVSRRRYVGGAGSGKTCLS